MIIVKRALLAGGFGTGKGWIGDERPLEIAPVVNEHAQPVLTEHARRIQASHFRRRYPPSVASGTGTPVRGRASTSGLQQLTEEGTSNSGSDTDAAEYDSNKEGARQTSEMDISEEGERDVEANRTKEQMENEEKFGLPSSHVGGHVWADSIPDHDDAHMEAPVVSSLFPRFHLDLSSAVAAAIGKDDW